MASSALLGGCVVVERQTRPPPPSSGEAPVGERPPQADPAPVQASSDRLLVGSLGWALLSPDVPNVALEIDQLGGAALDRQAVEALEQALREHGGKQAVEVVVGRAPATEDVYSLEALVQTAQEHRNVSSGGDTVAVHVLVLPGRFEAEGVPGVAFHATTMAMFPQEVDRMLPARAETGGFEAAVAVHELGHLFGLVNRTGVGAFHESPDYPGHTDDEDSVMYWAIESPSLRDLFRTGPPREFNDDDRREMERIREQRP